MAERHKGRTMGVIASVPCPWCNKANDFRELHAQTVLEQGCTASCDHCGKMMIVEAIDTRPRVIVRQKHT